jgi:hypothetical protein
MATKTTDNILNTKPLLLESHSCNFPEDIIIKINNILCEEYIKLIFDSLQNNFIKNIIYIFLNDKKLSKFVYYFAFQKYRYIYILDGVYGETLNNLGWEHFETDILYENFNGISSNDKDAFILNLERDEIFSRENNYTNNTEIDYYKYDVNIYSCKLTLNETMWIIKNFAMYDTNILKNNIDNDIDIDINDERTYDDIYDYDKEDYATIWNLFNRGFIQLNIFKIIHIYCNNTDINEEVQKYYNFIGGTGYANIFVDKSKLFHKTCYNVVKYFNKKMKKAADDKMVLSYLYGIYNGDDTVNFNDKNEKYENEAYDLLSENGLLSSNSEDITDILDFLYERYLQ